MGNRAVPDNNLKERAEEGCRAEAALRKTKQSRKERKSRQDAGAT